MDRLIIFMMWLAFTEILISLAGDFSLAVKMAVVLGISMPPIIWLSGILCWISGYRPARFLVIAWTFFLITVLIGGFMHASILPTNTFTFYSMQIGSGVEIILLSWALADRMAILKQEKLVLQKAYTEQLEHNNISLEQQVLKRTLDLDKAVNLANEKARLLRKANSELKELAIRDGLTGLLNHVAFVAQFKHIIEDAKRYEYYVSLLLLDIDDFKLINDTYGHLLGNKVLCLISNILQDEVRESDIAARYGGEEFVVVLSRATLTEALDKAEHLRQMVEQIDLGEAQGLQCTISIGVTTADWHNKEVDCNLLLKDADSAMYKAKGLGKNCICTADVEYKLINGGKDKLDENKTNINGDKKILIKPQ